MIINCIKKYLIKHILSIPNLEILSQWASKQKPEGSERRGNEQERFCRSVPTRQKALVVLCKILNK
jgi:hypothetical protein